VFYDKLQYHGKVFIKYPGVYGLENEKTLVSVIIPSHNGAKYIKDALNSVLLQDVSLEIIFIDDFSSDDTDEIIETYTKKYGNIVYLKNKESLGASKTRNKGVAFAKGEYIAFLDVDDVWEKGKLTEQLNLLKKNNAVFSYTARELITDNGKSTGRIISVPEKVNYYELLKTNFIPCSSVVLLKSVAEEFPMVRDSLHEDYLNWLMILKKYNVAYGINKPLLKYRLTPNGKSRNRFKSAVMTYRVHREMNTNAFLSVYYTLLHLLNGIKKYSLGGRKGENNEP